jgi:hypothetical protein
MRPQPPEPSPAGLPEFVLDGISFDDLAGFFTAITRTLGVIGWGRNLDAFNDILRGGFGTPEGGFVLRWVNSAEADLAAARRGQGQTLFGIITSIIRVHGPGGIEAEDNVHLILA